jgi:aspartyl-tRNA(Asn)/glutamyl-tRNA(Gln) amidotransferase subunit A
MLTDQFHTVLKDVDILISPTQPTAAPLIETSEKVFANAEDVAKRLHTHRSFCASFAMAALPAISIPCGFTANGLPVGLHLAGRPFGEEQLFQVAYAYQESTQWNKSLPPLAIT